MASIYKIYNEDDPEHESEPIYWNPRDLSITYCGKKYTHIFNDFGDAEEVDKIAFKRLIDGYLPTYFTLYPREASMLVGFFVRRRDGGVAEITRVWS